MDHTNGQGEEPGRPVTRLVDWRGRPPRPVGPGDWALLDAIDDPEGLDGLEYHDAGTYERPGQSDRLGSMTLLVMMDDQVVDVLRRPVEGTGYECAALEGGRGRKQTPPTVVAPRPPQPPRHVRELAWLARLVGGEDALANLPVDPLPHDEPLDLDAVPAHLRDRVGAMGERLDDVVTRLFDAEVRTVCRRLLVRAVAAEPSLLRGPARDEVVPGAVLWAAAKANDLVGSGHQMPVSAIQAVCGLRSSPSESEAGRSRMRWPDRAESPSARSATRPRPTCSSWRPPTSWWRGCGASCASCATSP
ncbi:hypothetical protein GCM10027517_38020 [Phycicoccus ginsengisoli]